MSDIDKRLEKLVAELYAPTAEGRRCIGLAQALLRARRALGEAQGRLGATAEYIGRDTPVSNDPLYANAVRAWSRDTANALADTELEELLR